MRKLIVFLSLMLSLLMLPGAAFSGTGSSFGTAVIDFNSLTFSRADLNWIDPVALLDTRGTLSGVSVTLNCSVEPYSADFIDGAPWGNTAVSATHPASTLQNKVTGSAFTNVTNPLQPALSSTASVKLAKPVATGSVDVAQAVFSGQFTVPTNGILTVTANYKLHQELLSSYFSSSNVAAGLSLYDFNGFDPATGQSPLLASDLQFLQNQINGLGGLLVFDKNGTLTMTFDLVALDAFGLPIIYDFEAFTNASGTVTVVPEPMSFVLVGAGLIALAAFRKRFA